MNKQTKNINDVVPLSLPVGAGFFGSVLGYAGKQPGIPKKATLSIAQTEAVRRSLGIIEAILKGELDIENHE